MRIASLLQVLFQLVSALVHDASSRSRWREFSRVAAEGLEMTATKDEECPAVQVIAVAQYHDLFILLLVLIYSSEAASVTFSKSPIIIIHRILLSLSLLSHTNSELSHWPLQLIDRWSTARTEQCCNCVVVTITSWHCSVTISTASPGICN